MDRAFGSHMDNVRYTKLWLENLKGGDHLGVVSIVKVKYQSRT